MTDQLSHVNASGAATMVDTSGKSVSLRKAVAEGRVLMAPATMKRLLAADTPKGEVLATARIAGIMAAKQTGTLIPLCHPLPLDQVTVDFQTEKHGPDGQRAAVRITASATVTAKTGIEMETLVAVSVAALTVYDMLKAIDRTMTITGIRLLSKTGGKSDFVAADR